MLQLLLEIVIVVFVLAGWLFIFLKKEDFGINAVSFSFIFNAYAIFIVYC